MRVKRKLVTGSFLLLLLLMLLYLLLESRQRLRQIEHALEEVSERQK
jgi:hypothetical protein